MRVVVFLANPLTFGQLYYYIGYIILIYIYIGTVVQDRHERTLVYYHPFRKQSLCTEHAFSSVSSRLLLLLLL